MATRLKNILRFAPLAPGANAALPHLLNWEGRAVVPDSLLPSVPGFTFVTTPTTVTATNNGPVLTAVDVLCESWHTLERGFGAVQTIVLTPQPFVPSYGGAGAGAGGAFQPEWLEEWETDNLPANQPATDLFLFRTSLFPDLAARHAGRLWSLTARLSAPILVGGALTARFTVNGAGVVGSECVLDPTNQIRTVFFGALVVPFAQGDLLGVEFETNAAWGNDGDYLQVFPEVLYTSYL